MKSGMSWTGQYKPDCLNTDTRNYTVVIIIDNKISISILKYFWGGSLAHIAMIFGHCYLSYKALFL